MSFRLPYLMLFGLVANLAALAESQAGIGFDIGLGYPNAYVSNPDGSRSNYTGLAAEGRFVTPVVTGSRGAITLDLVGRYVDLNNTASSAAQRENGNLLGLGISPTLLFGKIYFGADFIYMRARHFFVGTKNQYIEYEMPIVGYFVGLKTEIGKSLQVSVSYSQASGQIPSSKTLLSEDSPYRDSIYWVKFTYDTGAPLGKFFLDLFQ